MKSPPLGSNLLPGTESAGLLLGTTLLVQALIPVNSPPPLREFAPPLVREIAPPFPREIAPPLNRYG